MAVYQVSYKIPESEVQLREPNYVRDQAEAFGTWDDLPDDARAAAIEAWGKEDPTHEVWVVTPTLESIRSMGSRQTELQEQIAIIDRAKVALVSEILEGWTLADATAVVRTKIVRRGGVTRSVPVTAIEELAKVAGLTMPWRTLHQLMPSSWDKHNETMDRELRKYIHDKYKETSF